MNRLPLQELIWQLEPPDLDSERPDRGYGPESRSVDRCCDLAAGKLRQVESTSPISGHAFDYRGCRDLC
jgi:hypothetical protein